MSEEMAVQILSRLPPKSLMRFKCVHKSWCALVNDPTFAATHLCLYNKSSSTTILTKRSVINRTENINEEVVFSLLNLDDENDDEDNVHAIVEDVTFPATMCLKTRGQYIENPTPLPRSVNQATCIIGHCDGIIILLNFHTISRVVLWNPAIKEFRFVKSEDSDLFHAGFGYDPKSKDYILVNVMSTGEEVYDNDRVVIHPPRAKLYTLGIDSWREINSNYLETETTNFWPTDFEFCIKGCFYWFGTEQKKDIISIYNRDDYDVNRTVLIFFDTGDGMFHTLLLPDGFYDPNEGLYTMSLAMWNESLALYGFHCIGDCLDPFEIWVMIDFDGYNCSWIKHFSVQPKVQFYMPMAVWKKYSVILTTTEGRIVSYNVDINKIRYFPVHGVFRADFQYVVCSNSIVSVKPGQLAWE